MWRVWCGAMLAIAATGASLAADGAPAAEEAVLREILAPGEAWELVGEGYGLSEGPAVNARGEVFFSDIPRSRNYRIDASGVPRVFVADTKRTNGQIFGPDGRLYAVETGTQRIVAYDETGAASVVAEGIAGNDLVVAHTGKLYVTHPARKEGERSRIWLIRPGGEKVAFDAGELTYANGIALSPDQTAIVVADYRGEWVFRARVKDDGSLETLERFARMRSPEHAESLADGLKFDEAGRLYVATRIGVQVCDEAGRVMAVIPTPNGKITNLVFGGENFDVLYATCNEAVYRRKVTVRGVNAWAAPVE